MPLSALSAPWRAALLALLAATLCAAIFVLVRPGDQPLGAATDSRGPTAAARSESVGAATSVGAIVSPPLPTEVPPGLSAEQWQSLRAQYAGKPEGDAEMARVVAYLQYQQAVQALRGARGLPADAALQAAAERVDAGLADRIARGEVSAGEALQLKAAALEVLQPDADARRAELAGWRAAQQADAGSATERHQALRFREGEAALLARFRALPAAQRDATQLAAQLQALREQVFDAPPPQQPRPLGDAR